MDDELEKAVRMSGILLVHTRRKDIKCVKSMDIEGSKNNFLKIDSVLIDIYMSIFFSLVLLYFILMLKGPY